MVYGLFRLAAIMQGIAKRAIDGTAASREAEVLGRLARPVGEEGLGTRPLIGRLICFSFRHCPQKRASKATDTAVAPRLPLARG
jgi:hypothetical protein